jgi:hypothetical protein
MRDCIWCPRPHIELAAAQAILPIPSIYRTTSLHAINMTSRSARATTSSTTRTSSLHPRLTFRHILDLVLFFVIPVYTHFCISPSISSAFWHIYLTGSTGICIVHLTRGMVSLDQIGNMVYGLVISSFPRWSKSYPLLASILPNSKGWRGAVIYWAFTTLNLTCLLPEPYGRDIKVRSAEAVLL